MPQGPVILVTGAASGIGRAVAERLRQSGASVLGADLAGCEITADLSTPEGRSALVEAASELGPGGLDAVIACAGVASRDGPLMASVNFFGAIGTLGGLAPLLRKRPAPRAVAVASSAAILPTDPALVEACLAGDERSARRLAADNPLAYASTKLALSRWVRRTAVSPGWADRGLLLNAVAPGLVVTPMTAPLLATEEGRARLARDAPHATPSPAQPEDIAPLLAFLAGPDNRYMVGQTVFCDGGKDALLRPLQPQSSL